MSRAEFTKPTKRAALKRSGLKCEASGRWYGLPDDQRCGASLAYGVRFEHIIIDANSHDNSLENCAAVCMKCWRYKTDHNDIPVAAKTLRQQDKYLGVTRRSSTWPKGRRLPTRADRERFIARMEKRT